MKALLIVNLSSLDSYAEYDGLPAAQELAGRLKEAILSYRGPVYVIDQRWPRSKWSEPRWELVFDVQLKREIHWVHFRDNQDDWDLFIQKLRAQLIRDGVKELDLGGLWYSRDGSSCVSEVQGAFRRHFKIHVVSDLVGCWSESKR